MYAIFTLECKKALSSRKNRLILVLYTMLLIVFILANMRTFSDVREREMQRFLTMSALSEINADLRWSRTSYNPYVDEYRATHWGADVEFNRSTQYNTRGYRMQRQSAEYGRLMILAMTENDRETELVVINSLHRIYEEFLKYRIDLFSDTQRRDGNSVVVRNHHGYLIPVSWTDAFRYYEAQHNFTRHFIENDILFIYESEMRGLNFTYQALRQILPIIMMFIITLSLSDIFTSDNQWGSYKFLLVNPVSRAKVYIAKVISASTIAFVMVFGSIAVLGFTMGIINGFGPVNYPILTQRGAYTSFNALRNNIHLDGRIGNISYWGGIFQMQYELENNGMAYATDHHAIGLTPITSAHLLRSYYFAPNLGLRYTPMLQVVFMTMPLYFLLILLVSATSALLSVIFQRGLPTMITGAILSLAVLLFPAPVSNISIFARLNPFLYVNPINILNGLGSTTALTGVVVLAGWSVVLVAIGIRLFNKQDIKC